MVKKLKASDFYQKNPHDEKNPFLNNANKLEKENLPKILNFVNDQKSFKERSEFIIENNNFNKENSEVKKRIQEIRNKKSESENNSNYVEDRNNFIIPDPNSPDSLISKFNRYDIEYGIRKRDEVKKKIQNLNYVIRKELNFKDIKKIVKAFKWQVIKIGKKEVVLKGKKFGFEIYYNKADSRWWVVTIDFIEPFNPKKISYITYWVGNSFIGYGYETLDDVIQKTYELLTTGRTGFVYWNDFAINYNKINNRIIASPIAKQFTYKEYINFYNWFTKNKIWIMVKKEDKKDSEDLMIELREKRKRGENINPLASIQAKMMESPRKPTTIVAFPVEKPSYRGSEWEIPDNKLYEIGFIYNEK